MAGKGGEFFLICAVGFPHRFQSVSVCLFSPFLVCFFYLSVLHRLSVGLFRSVPVRSSSCIFNKYIFNRDPLHDLNATSSHHRERLRCPTDRVSAGVFFSASELYGPSFSIRAPRGTELAVTSSNYAAIILLTVNSFLFLIRPSGS